MEDRFLSSQDIRDLVSNPQQDRMPIAFIPVGCTEQHGPFLPLETDTIIAEGMARSLARRLQARRFPIHVFPAVAYSPTRSNASFPGTVSVGEQAFRDYLSSILHSLMASEFGTVILISGHGPADPSLREIAFREVDAQFRVPAGTKKPVISISLAEASSELRNHFQDPLGRHADWREFLMVHHILGPCYFTEDRIQALKTFQRENDFTLSTNHVPGVPLELRSIQGVIGQPLPSESEGYCELAEKAWEIIENRLLAEVLGSLTSFPRKAGSGSHAD